MEQVQRQTRQELERECFGTICHAATDLARAAEQRNAGAVEVQFDFIKVQMRRLDTIRKGEG